MTFYNRKYKITLYKTWLFGSTYREGKFFAVYKPCTKSGLFGDYIYKSTPVYYSVKDAVSAMKKHLAESV